MKHFTELFTRLDQTTSTNEKVAAMVDYFHAAPATDAAWAVYFLCGRRLKRLLRRASLRQWLAEETGYPDWLIEESYSAVGDLAETIALLLPEPNSDDLDDTALKAWVESRLLPLGALDEPAQRSRVVAYWRQLPAAQRLVLNKLITGGFRLGVSRRLVIRALAQWSGIDSAVIAHRLMGQWQPDADFMAGLLDPDTSRVASSTPYPFFLASPLKQRPEELGSPDEWQAEWKWDGIRAQLIRRDGESFIWSRGEELLNGRFPELEAELADLPDGTVLDGEILTWRDGRPAGFASLQTRIGRLKPSEKLLRAHPAAFMVYDLLEDRGMDQRGKALDERRRRLRALLPAGQRFMLSPPVGFDHWQELAAAREQSRERGVEGLMLKRRDSRYQVGRRVGDWWKWKIEPRTIDAVLIYAQPGHGRRSNQLTDYTFGVWDGDTLITICKAYSGLDAEEITRLDRWIRQHTTERFGPVRAVEATHVFEIAFDGMQASRRHKSGIAFRFPRIKRWRHDLATGDAETLAQVQAMLESDPS